MFTIGRLGRGDFFLMLFCNFSVIAHTQSLPPYQPSHTEMMTRYRAAAQRDSAVKNTIFKAAVNAHWLPDAKSFW